MASSLPTSAVPSARIAKLTLAQQLLVFVFIAVAVWYLGWRPGTFNPQAPVFSLVVYAAELFGFTGALLHLFVCWRLQVRTPLPPPKDASVAVFVPTINESVDMLRRTLLAAQRMRYASEVWLLDDGNREEMRALARELGCKYLARTENSHAKAGNLNNALAHTRAEFIAIFDADHAPAPAFLEETLGFFADPRVAFVQTPQDFYNLDSFQHRLDRHRSLVWSEQTLFFRVIQAGKDRLNAAFFCGSCAVARRTALEDIGGFATGTVTEDIHTSLRLHKRGWRSVYYARSLAFGLAPATILPFLKQRLRWGQGAMQVWRQEGVLFTRGLSVPQRLSYLATMLAYFEGWQRAVLFLAPVIVLTTGLMPVAAIDLEFLARFVPYYLLTFWVFEEVGRGYGRSILTEQYNMLRFAVFITATLGLFLRRLAFVVTPKQMGQAEVTHRTLWPQYLIIGLNAIAVPIGLVLYVNYATLPAGALVANILWALLVLAIGVAAIRYTWWVGSFRRGEYRFPLPLPLRVLTHSGPLTGIATDISPRGFRLQGLPVSRAAPGVELKCELLLPHETVPLRAKVRVVRHASGEGHEAAASAGCEITELAPVDRNTLELFLFGSDLQWQLNGLADRVRPPLERLHDALAGGSAQSPVTAGQRWWPLIFKPNAAGALAGVGFISADDGRSGERTVAILAELSGRRELDAEELTPMGIHPVLGKVAEQAIVESDAAPIHVYRLTA